MTEQEIKDIVTMTLDELLDRGLISKDSSVNYAFMGNKLKEYYKTGQKNENITDALEKIKDDPYFHILPEYYGLDHTLIHIAVDAGCDRKTIVNNKKRLGLELYRLCYPDYIV